MAYYKLNYLVWHIADDEAWRLDLPLRSLLRGRILFNWKLLCPG